MPEQCKGCRYYGKSADTCDFYLSEKVRRGCSVDNCTRFEPKSLKKKLPPLLPPVPHAALYEELGATAEKLIPRKETNP